jgi:hypothetical protein
MSQIGIDYLHLTRFAHQTTPTALTMSLDTALPHGETLIAERRVISWIWRRYALLHGITHTRQYHELACSREVSTAEYVARIAGVDGVLSVICVRARIRLGSQ